MRFGLKESVKARPLPEKTKAEIQQHRDKAHMDRLKASATSQAMRQLSKDPYSVTASINPVSTYFHHSASHHTDRAHAIEREHISRQFPGKKAYHTAFAGKPAVKWKDKKTGKKRKAYVQYSKSQPRKRKKK